MVDPKIIGIIPARYGSTRFPGKMLAPILGKSLIQRTYENALKFPLLSQLLVATDNAQILAHVEGFGGKAVLTSPEHISGTDRIVEAIKTEGFDADIVVLIQGDEPCLSPTVVSTLIQDLMANPQADMTTPVEPISSVEDLFAPNIVKCVFDNKRKALYFSRAPIPFPMKKESAVTYYRHIGVYCYRKNFLMRYAELPASNLQKSEDLEQLKILEHGHTIYVSIVEPQGVVAVDTPEDIKKVEGFLC